MIPDSKKEIVKKALNIAFGVESYDSIKQITIGLSNALTFRIVVESKPYFMKIARTDELSSQINNFQCMKLGADEGIAPKVWYLNTEEKILITDFIESKPFPTSKAREIMPKIIRRLHNLSPFHKSTNYFESMDKLVQNVLRSKLLPDDLTDEILKSYNRIMNIYPNNPNEFVSSHNDLKPENYIFDGERVWLIDWEAAFLNDPYVDLAVVSNFVVNNEDDELQYLKNYFGEVPSEYVKARFFLVQQILHVFYMSIFIMYSSKNIPINIDNKNVNFSNFHKIIWEGEIDLSNDENKLQYALVHMNKFLSNIKFKRFEDSLNIISKVK